MIRQLAAIRNRFTEETRTEKEVLLSLLSRTQIDEPQQLIDYHEALLFIRAYPADREILRLASAECDRFIARVRRLRKRDPDGALLLDDTGITGTTMHYEYDYAAVVWLLQWFGDDLDIDWEELESTDKLDILLTLIAEWCENDGLDLADLTTDEWLALRMGDPSRSSLRWIVERIEAMRAPHSVRRTLYDAMNLPVIWELGDTPVSTIHGRMGRSEPYFHDEPLLRKMPAFLDAIREPLPPASPVPSNRARHLIKLLRCVLAVRHRSLYPIEYASSDDVLVADCGRGYTLVLYGVQQRHRLTLESDYAALIVKNGYVIGYGVGAILFDQVEIAVNIFASWRGGEAAFIFSQFIRFFHNQFGCTRFKIERYQVGYENDEGLQSGSFWFYYNLGFRPIDRKVAALAGREAKKIGKDRSYRTPIATLEELAVSDQYLMLDGPSTGISPDFPLVDLSVSATRKIGQDFDGDATKAIASCTKKAAAALGCRGWTKWPTWEREWLRRLSLIIVQIPRLDRWPAREKKDLVEIIRAKGRPGETRFVHLCREHKRFRKALERIAAKGK